LRLSYTDSDYPDPSTSILPHYGYEIYFNKKRVAGPGHVYFTDIGPEFYRDGKPMHELQKGFNCDQKYSGRSKTQKPIELELRLDYAFRLWSLGADKEAEDYSSSAQEYKEITERPPELWKGFERPCFGLSKETDWSD